MINSTKKKSIRNTLTLIIMPLCITSILLSAEVSAVENEEYAVYSNVISQMESLNKAPELYVVKRLTTNKRISDQKFDREIIDFFEKEAGLKIDIDLIEDFLNKNKEIYELENNFSLNKKVVLISEDESNKIFKEGGWDNFYSKYPHSTGIIEISRVGFNNNHSEAIMYFGFLEYYEAGIGYLAYLVKIGQDWEIRKKITLWIS